MAFSNLEIAVPTYERGSVRRAVESALEVASQLPGVSVRVYNNGTPAPLRKRLSGLGVEVVQNPANLGMVGNWNQVLSEAQGRHLILLHDDDALLAAPTVRAFRRLEASPTAAMIFSAVHVVDEPGRRVRRFAPFPADQEFESGRAGLALASKAVPVKAPGVILNLGRIRDAGLRFREDHGYAADAGFYLAAALRFPVLYSSEPSAEYAMSEGSATYRDMMLPADIEMLVRVRDGLLASAAAAGLAEREWIEAVNRWCHRHAIISMLFRSSRGEHEVGLACLGRARQLAGEPGGWGWVATRLLVLLARFRMAGWMYRTLRRWQTLTTRGQARPGPMP